MKEQEINSRDAEGRKQGGNVGNVDILKELLKKTTAALAWKSLLYQE